MEKRPHLIRTRVTIRDLLSDDSLSTTAAVLPPGTAERTISWVHATEQLDPRPHLRKHELVCTLGSSLVRPRSATTFVRALSQSGVAGIALGLGEVHLEPPDELRQACVDFGVPLLLLEHGVPFLAINDAVLKRRSQLENKARKHETSLLTRLMTMAGEGASEATLLATASAVLNGEIARRTASSEQSIFWNSDSEAPSGEFMIQLESLLQFCGLEQAREAVEQQQRLGQLVDLISNGLAHPAAMLPEIESQGLDPSSLRVSFWPLGSESVLSQRWDVCLIGTTSREVVLLTNSEPKEAFEKLGFVCGYSGSVPYANLRRAFIEARAAQRLARSRGGVAGPGELASFETLLEQQPPELLAPFVEQLAGPIVRSDETGRGDLMRTLATFIDEDRQLQSTADRLFVHVNTVRHRLTKVLELTGRDPLTLAGISDLKVAVWATERHHALRRRVSKSRNI